MLGTGLITLRELDRDGVTWSDAETFDVEDVQGTSAGQFTASGYTLTIYPTSLSAATKYSILIEDTAVGEFAGIAEEATLQFVADLGVTLPSKNPADYTTVIQNQTFTSQQDFDSGDDDTLILNCTFNMGLASGQYGLRVRNVDGFTIADCTFNDCSEAAILLRGTGSTANVAILDCTINNAQRDGIQTSKVEGSSVDHTNLIISGNTVNYSGQSSTSGQFHGIYCQATDAVIQYNQILGEVDGNGISFRCAATVFANNVDATSRASTDKACIRYYADHLAGPIGAPRTNDQILIAYNTCDGQSDFAYGIDIARPSSQDTLGYTDAEFNANDVQVWGNTYIGTVIDEFTFTTLGTWPSGSWIEIEENGVVVLAGA